MPLQRGQLQELQSIASDLIQQSLAPSTHSTYQRAIDYYHRFVSSFALPREIIPVQAEDIYHSVYSRLLLSRFGLLHSYNLCLSFKFST